MGEIDTMIRMGGDGGDERIKIEERREETIRDLYSKVKNQGVRIREEIKVRLEMNPVLQTLYE